MLTATTSSQNGCAALSVAADDATLALALTVAFTVVPTVAPTVAV